mmetsp:Transcript_18035/g.37405  ORF Transcript_18035/g.37405 Transcript_18035/m.37405 type:complete len:139 (-) Transcript_18035:4495-4911(-)
MPRPSPIAYCHPGNATVMLGLRWLKFQTYVKQKHLAYYWGKHEIKVLCSSKFGLTDQRSHSLRSWLHDGLPKGQNDIIRLHSAQSNLTGTDGCQDLDIQPKKLKIGSFSPSLDLFACRLQEYQPTACADNVSIGSPTR